VSVKLTHSAYLNLFPELIPLFAPGARHGACYAGINSSISDSRFGILNGNMVFSDLLALIFKRSPGLSCRNYLHYRKIHDPFFM
jgi:hypothetical protein